MEKRIIEIGGVKVEVDLRYAKQVESYKIGDNVKVLKKEYSDIFKSHPGVIIGFDNFQERPTIVIAYLKQDYSNSRVEFLYLTKDSRDVEICPMIGEDLIINKTSVIETLDREIIKKEQELIEVKSQRAYFLENFGKYFNREEDFNGQDNPTPKAT